jgi:hypothetical protein
MFNSVAFDVVIGLVLIYLLYSLLVTIVGEMVATWIGLRSRILRLAIEKMLNDGYFTEDGKLKYSSIWSWDFLQRYFLKEFKDFKYSFAGKFYEQPSIKYLSNKASEGKTFFSQTKPSYFTADNFADTLINLLREKGAGLTDIERVAFSLRFNTHHIQPETLKNISRIFNDSGNDINVFKEKLKAWFNETNDRCTGWYKRKLQLILFWLGFIIAAAFNVDSLKIARFLAKDPDARNQLVNMGVQLAKDSSRYADFIMVNGDTLHSKAILDSGYSHISKDINEANLILGLGWPFDKLRKNETYEIAGNSRGNDFKQGIAYANTLDNLRYTSDTISQKLISRSLLNAKKKEIASQKLLLADTFFVKNFQDRVAIIKDSLNKNQQSYFNDSIANAYRFDRLSELQFNIDTALKNINTLTGNKFSKIVSIDTASKKSTIIISGERPYRAPEKIFYVIGQLFSSGSRFLGFIITALMLSLGAPFWFDLLKKLVSLRGAGVKPEEKKIDNSTTSAKIIHDSGALKDNQSIMPVASVDAALVVYGDEIRKENGVVNVYKGYFFIGSKSNECLQVNVLDNSAKIAIENKYKNVKLFKDVVLKVDVTGLPKTHGGAEKTIIGNPERGIANSTELLGWGSFGCIMIDNSDPDIKYILSCYHVMNGDLVWKNNGDNRIIQNQKTQIANSYEGSLNAKLDAAYTSQISQEIYDFYARWKPKDKLTVMPKHLKKKVHFKGYITKSNDGIIVNDSCPASFDYPVGENTFISQEFEDLVAVSNFDNNIQKPISQGGDSGSLVVDENGFAIGIIIGSDLIQTFLIKITTIENEMNISLDC